MSGDRRTAGMGRGGPATRPRAEAWFAAAHGASPIFTLYFRTAPGEAGRSAVAAAHDQLAALAPALDAQRLRSLGEIERQAAGHIGWMARILGGFAGVAVALAMLGLYGVLAWSVAQRTREIGVRLALGARAGEVRRMVVLDGLSLVTLGGLMGAVGGAALSRLLTSILFGVHGLDPFTYAAAGAAVLAVATAAAWLPAHHASRVEPLVALRQDT